MHIKSWACDVMLDNIIVFFFTFLTFVAKNLPHTLSCILIQTLSSLLVQSSPGNQISKLQHFLEIGNVCQEIRTDEEHMRQFRPILQTERYFLWYFCNGWTKTTFDFCIHIFTWDGASVCRCLGRFMLGAIYIRNLVMCNVMYILV